MHVIIFTRAAAAAASAAVNGSATADVATHAKVAAGYLC
jgi:hypothetical protein